MNPLLVNIITAVEIIGVFAVALGVVVLTKATFIPGVMLLLGGCGLIVFGRYFTR